MILDLSQKSPVRAILLQSPGRKPWVNRSPHLLSPVGAAQLQSKCPNTRAVSAAPAELDITFHSYIPRVSFRALPSLHPGLCRSVVPTALIMRLSFDAVVLDVSSLNEKITLSLFWFKYILRYSL